MRYLILALLIGCNTYSGVVVSIGGIRDVEVQVSEFHYVIPLMEWNQFDSLVVGDTI